MAKVIITEQYLEDIADAIRAKNGSQDTYYPFEMADAISAIDTSGVTINNQNKSVTPTESSQSVTADSGYTGLGTVTVGAISSSYVGSGVTQRTSTDLSASGATITAPAGYYAVAASKAVSSGTEGTPTATKGTVSNHSVSVTPSVTNSAGYISGGTHTGTAVSVSASELVSGNKAISANGNNIDVTNYATVSVSVSSDAPTIDTLSVTPSETEQTFNSSSVDGYKPVTVGAISSTYVGSGITRRDSTDLTASGRTVTVPSGYYSSQATYNMPSKDLSAGNITLSLDSTTGIVSAYASISSAQAGYYGTQTTGNKTLQLTLRDSTDLTASGATVSVPAGYYSAAASKSVASGIEGTPTATKGTVSNHAVTVIPSVTNTAGYITGSTKTGTAVTVTASELASGNKAITENGTNIDVVGYSTVSINVPNNDVWKPVQAQTRTIVEDPNGNYLWYDDTTPAFAEGQTWRVTWGDETYIVQTKYVEIDGVGYWVIGNPGAIGYTDDGTGYPWIAWNSQTNATAVGTQETGRKHVILELQQSNPYQAKTVTYTPSETQQTATVVPDTGYNGLSTVGITVDAISSTYVGSGIARKSSADLTVSGATVTAPAGYYSAAASKSVSSMTLPTAATSSATSGYTSKATIGRSTAAQYINIPPGYNSTGAYYVISAVANGSATAPSTISGTSATVSTGTNTLTLTKTISVTPTVSAGYVSSGTAGNSSVSLTASVTTKAAATITPTTTNQTIAAGTYLTGTQTIAGDADLIGSNILSTANIFGVQGTVVVQNYYTGSSAPASGTGSNGDLYLQT